VVPRQNLTTNFFSQEVQKHGDLRCWKSLCNWPSTAFDRQEIRLKPVPGNSAGTYSLVSFNSADFVTNEPKLKIPQTAQDSIQAAYTAIQHMHAREGLGPRPVDAA